MSTIAELGNKNYKLGSMKAIDYDPMFKRIEALGDRLRKMNQLEICKDLWAFCTIYNRINEEDFLGRINFLTEKNIELNTTRHRQAEELVKCRLQIVEYEKQLISAGLLKDSDRFQIQDGSSKKHALSEDYPTSLGVSAADISNSKSNATEVPPVSEPEE